jgi:hypothetical protein
LPKNVPDPRYRKIGIHQILFWPDIRPARYMANPKAGYWKYDRKSDKAG